MPENSELRQMTHMFEEIRNVPKVKSNVIVLTEEQFELLKKEINPDIKPTADELLKGTPVHVVSATNFAETVFQLLKTKNVVTWSTKNEA